jgi:signal peptidase I
MQQRQTRREDGVAEQVMAAPRPLDVRPDGAARAWLRLALVLTSRAYLGVLAGLLLWALVPILAGWHTDVVLTGSMLPRIRPGDAVVSQPVDPASVRPDQVLSFDDPARDGRRVIHRVSERLDDGRLITRGDANAHEDSTPLPPEGINGLGRLRVPSVGLPVVWLHEQRYDRLAALAVWTLAAVTAVARDGGPGRPKRSPVGRRSRLALGCALLLVPAVAATMVRTGEAAFSAPAGNPQSTWAAAASFATCTPSTQTVTATADTYVRKDSPTNTFGSASPLRINGRQQSTMRAYLAFALPPLPPACTVTGATLRVTVDSGTTGRTLQAQRVLGPWTETGLTWNTQPTFSSPSTAASVNSGPLTFAVTGQVQALYAGSNNGFVLKDSVETSGSGTLQRVEDRTSAAPPQLTITFG